MATAQDHYDGLLGPVYAWMVGDFDAAAARHAALFERLSIRPGATARAVDLGAGHGTSTRPLAELGFDVVALDFCAALLEELGRRCAGLRVRGVEGDIADFERHVETPVDVVACLTDTLVHLPDEDAVDALLAGAGRALAPGGRFVATFRDYVSRTPAGTERFIPVRADDTRILTCVLDYGPERVTVYDLLHERGADGVWRQRVSSYTKLRIDPARLAERAAAAGLEVEYSAAEGGMHVFAARRR